MASRLIQLFVNLLAARGKVLKARKVKYSHLGFSTYDTINYLAIYEHLTPRLQDLLFEGKKFQSNRHYQFC